MDADARSRPPLPRRRTPVFSPPTNYRIRRKIRQPRAAPGGRFEFIALVETPSSPASTEGKRLISLAKREAPAQRGQELVDTIAANSNRGGGQFRVFRCTVRQRAARSPRTVAADSGHGSAARDLAVQPPLAGPARHTSAAATPRTRALGRCRTGFPLTPSGTAGLATAVLGSPALVGKANEDISAQGGRG
jgi:hypothetical protein